MSGNLKIKDSTIIQLYSRADAPCRDYYGLTITDTNILFSTWKISYGPHLHPKCKIVSFKDIKNDKYIQEEIRSIFGYEVFLYIRSLYNNEHKLETLPNKLFFQLMEYLKIKDILNLIQTSKILKELCSRDTVWKIIYQKYLKRNCYSDELRQSKDIGWREMVKRKIILRKKIETSQKLKEKPILNHKMLNKPGKQSLVAKLCDQATPRKPLTKYTITNISVKTSITRNKIGHKHESDAKFLDLIPNRPVIKKILPNKQVYNNKSKVPNISVQIKQ